MKLNLNNGTLQVPEDPVWLSTSAISPSRIAPLLLKLAYNGRPRAKKAGLRSKKKEKCVCTWSAPRHAKVFLTLRRDDIDLAIIQLTQWTRLGRIPNPVLSQTKLEPKEKEKEKAKRTGEAESAY